MGFILFDPLQHLTFDKYGSSKHSAHQIRYMYLFLQVKPKFLQSMLINYFATHKQKFKEQTLAGMQIN